MSIENTGKELSTFPFPSVTICNENKISKAKFDRLMKDSRYSVITPDQMKCVMLALMKIDETLSHRKEKIYSIKTILENSGIYMTELVSITMQVSYPSKTGNYSLVYYFNIVVSPKVMVSCKDILMDCQWLNRPTNCADMFEQTKDIWFTFDFCV